MIPKIAIEKAIEGGWKKWEHENATIYFYESNGCNGQPCWVIDHTYADPYHDDVRKGKKWHLRSAEIALNPTFWQALGKACGWKTEKNKSMIEQQSGDVFQHWYQKAMHFYDLVLNGKDTSDYWTEILK